MLPNNLSKIAPRFGDKILAGLPKHSSELVEINHETQGYDSPDRAIKPYNLLYFSIVKKRVYCSKSFTELSVWKILRNFQIVRAETSVWNFNKIQQTYEKV